MAPENSIVELRSDTFSTPSPEMVAALADAPLGDDVYGEDPTVNRLERRAAELTGNEAALLVTSGTQGNLTAVLAHTRPGDELILGENTDLLNYETSGLAAVAGVLARPVPDAEGAPRVDDVVAAVRAPDIHAGPTSLLALENTHQRSGGQPMPLDRLEALAAEMRERGISVHLDGARVFNAAVSLDVDVREIARHVDSVTFCLSKGLSCPAGSVLCGDEELIERARRARKMLGGGMRQAGWMAIAGVVALEDVGRLREDHANARHLAEGLAGIPQIEIDVGRVRTNIVYFELAADVGLDAATLTARLWSAGVRALPMGGLRVRMVTHRTIDRAAVDRAVETVRRACGDELVTEARVGGGYAD